MAHYTEEELMNLWADGLLTDEEYCEACEAPERGAQPTTERLSFTSGGRTRPR